MRLAITKRQKELLSIIYKFIKETGYPPNFEEMKDALNVVSNQSVVDLLGHLERKKFIKRDEGTARSIAILLLGYEALERPPLVPFLGITSAGAPLEAIEVSGDWEAISSEVTQLKDEVFLLRISGDSMINAGIDDGDTVLVKRQNEFVSGDIVLADVEGESMVKRFISDDQPPYIYLRPENPKYDVIPFTDKMKLKGKVVSVLNKAYWKPAA
ncbi:MAG TPA: transcriptional repressor LexA [Patescibacteria group bacterium]|nr:transcriptional repressor LexA [Patescibacteria group bacterium]